MTHGHNMSDGPSDPTAVMLTVTGHTATLVIDNDHLRVVITCKAPPEAECHGEPTCECEEFSTETLPDGSHGHTIYRDVHEFRPTHKFLLGRTLNGVAHCDLCDGRREISLHVGVPDGCAECDELPEHEMHTADEEVWHPHRQRLGYCNYLAWITESDNPETYYNGPPDIPLNDTPIEFGWDGEGYMWRPA